MISTQLNFHQFN